MLQNQRPNINLYRIDSKPNLYRIVLDVWAQEVIIFEASTSFDSDFVARMNLPCQNFLPWNVPGFVVCKTLLWRAETDLVKKF